MAFSVLQQLMDRMPAFTQARDAEYRGPDIRGGWIGSPGGRGRGSGRAGGDERGIDYPPAGTIDWSTVTVEPSVPGGLAGWRRQQEGDRGGYGGRRGGYYDPYIGYLPEYGSGNYWEDMRRRESFGGPGGWGGGGYGYDKAGRGSGWGRGPQEPPKEGTTEWYRQELERLQAEEEYNAWIGGAKQRRRNRERKVRAAAGTPDIYRVTWG